MTNQPEQSQGAPAEQPVDPAFRAGEIAAGQRLSELHKASLAAERPGVQSVPLDRMMREAADHGLAEQAKFEAQGDQPVKQ